MATTTIRHIWNKIWKDNHGKVVITQNPNIPLIGWLIFMIVDLVLPTGEFKTISSYLSFGFLFTWAFLELYSGTNYFRRFLGSVVLIYIVWSKV